MGVARVAKYVATAAAAVPLAWATPAQATTGVTGAGDPDAPLVLDPKTLPTDPLQLRLQVGVAPTVAYSERMAVTKTIDKVSIGDFQWDQGDCSSPPELRLSVVEHPAGNFDEFAGGGPYSEVNPRAPETAGVMSWTLNRKMTLHEGLGYSFHVQSVDPVACRYVYQTTWAHNSSQVNGGTNPCANGPYIGEYPGAFARRGWHSSGAIDGQTGERGCAGSAWSAAMPTGWMVSMPVGAGWDVATSFRAPQIPMSADLSPCVVAYQTDAVDRGGEIVDWTAQNQDGNFHYLCAWTQFAPLGQEISDGWYYGLPWRTERLGHPRDVYLKVGEDLTPPAVKFRPILKFDTSEKWRPLNINGFFAEGNQRVCLPRAPFTRQMAESFFHSGNTTAFNRATRCQVITDPAQLMSPPWKSAAAWVQVAGQGYNASTYHSPYAACLNGLLFECGLAPESVIYYNDQHKDATYEYLDYWVFYRYSDGPSLPFSGSPISKHQADLEGVTIAVPRANATTFHFAAFAQHNFVYQYLRENLSCDGGSPGSCGSAQNPKGERVNVYVVNGGHASYPQPCNDQLIGGYNLTCWQTSAVRIPGVGDSIPFPDAGTWNGSQPWAANNDPTAVVRLPQEAGAWPTWPGTWGVEGNTRNLINQPRYNAPENPPSTCSPGDGSKPPLCPARNQSSCDPWFGQMVSVAVCGRRRLPRSEATRALGRKGPLRVVFPKRTVATASAPGVTQAMGTVITPRDRTYVMGTITAGSTVLVRGFVPGRLAVATFDVRRALKNPAIRVRAAKGRVIISLVAHRVTLRPESIRTRRLTGPTRHRTGRPWRRSPRTGTLRRSWACGNC